MAKKRNEYQRIRDNIMRGLRRYKAKGNIIPEKAPLTPKQKGYKQATSQDIAELKAWGKRVLTSLGAEDDVDRLLGIARQTAEDAKEKLSARGKSYSDYVANEASVYVYNFNRSLKTKEYSDGASKVQKWYKKVRELIPNDYDLADFIKRAERDGLKIDNAIKYQGTANADNYIGDMTSRLVKEGYVESDNVKSLLTGVSELTEQAQQFFEEFVGGL